MVMNTVQTGPIVQPWVGQAAAQGVAVRVELRRYMLPRPNQMWELDDAPLLSLVSPRAEGTHGEVMFGAGDRQRHPVGPLMLRPAGIAMHSRGDGGLLDIVTFRFDPSRFAAVTGLRDWDADRLRRCAEIDAPSIRAVAGRLRWETLAPGFGSTLAIDALADLMMVDLGRTLGGARPGRAGRVMLASWQVERIEAALRSSQGAWPDTRTLATLCGISRSHLSRSFAATMGRRLADHAGTIRLERAREMVGRGQQPIGAIAHGLGFASASAFSAAFRRATGLTPRQFRQRTG